MAKKRKKKKNTKIYKYLFIILLILYIPSFVSWFINKNPELTVLKKGELIKSYETDAMMLRRAYVIRNTKKQDFEYLTENFTKIRKNQDIVSLYSNELNDLKKRKENIENEILETKLMLVKNSNIFNNTIKNLLEQKNIIIKKIYQNKNNLKGINTITKEVNEINANIIDIKFKEISKDDKIIDLENELNTINNAIDNKSQVIKSPESGILCFETDGFEYMEPLEFIQSLTTNKFQRILSGDIEGSGFENSIGKIVLDYDYYYILEIDQYIHNYIIDKEYVRINVNGVNDSFNTTIKKIIKDDDGIILVLSTDRFINANLDKRIVEINLLLESKSGIIIPRQSFYEFDSNKMQGSIMIARNGYIENVSVLIVDYNRDYAIIESEEIQIHDMLVSEPSKVKEGQDIN